jgi:hypothetical protein
MFEGCGGCCLGLLLIPLLCCALVGCAVIYVYTEGPEPPLSGNFKPQQAEAQSFQTAIDNAATMAGNQGWFYIQFNQRELSSWLALKGEDFAKEHDRSFPFKNVQVELADDKMTFYGELSRYRLKLPLRVVIKPGVDKQGQLDLKIDSVDFGGLRLPGFILDSVTNVLEDALMQPLKDRLDQTGRSYTLYEPSLNVSNGAFGIQGTAQ